MRNALVRLKAERTERAMMLGSERAVATAALSSLLSCIIEYVLPLFFPVSRMRILFSLSAMPNVKDAYARKTYCYQSTHILAYASVYTHAYSMLVYISQT